MDAEPPGRRTHRVSLFSWTEFGVEVAGTGEPEDLFEEDYVARKQEKPFAVSGELRR